MSLPLCYQEECARTLMFRGADKTLKNHSDETAYQVALASGNTELANIIQQFQPSQVGQYSIEEFVWSR